MTKLVSYILLARLINIHNFFARGPTFYKGAPGPATSTPLAGYASAKYASFESKNFIENTNLIKFDWN